MNVDITIVATILGILGSGAIVAIADRIRMGLRVAVLEALFSEKVKLVTILDSKTDEHSRQIVTIETVIPELRKLIDALKDVPGLLFTMKAMMDSDRERIKDMEQLIRVSTRQIIEVVPQSMQGPQGRQGPQGIQGEPGNR